MRLITFLLCIATFTVVSGCANGVAGVSMTQQYIAPEGKPTANVRIKGFAPGQRVGLSLTVIDPKECSNEAKITLTGFHGGALLQQSRKAATQELISEGLALNMPLRPDLKFPAFLKLKELKMEADKPLIFKFAYSRTDTGRTPFACSVQSILLAEENENYEVSFSLIPKNFDLDHPTLDDCKVSVFKLVPNAEKGHQYIRQIQPSVRIIAVKNNTLCEANTSNHGFASAVPCDSLAVSRACTHRAVFWPLVGVTFRSTPDCLRQPVSLALDI